jgi:hypothetical protein
MAKSLTEILDDVEELILSGGRRTTAANVRTLATVIAMSFPNVVDGGNVFEKEVGYATEIALEDRKSFANTGWVMDYVEEHSGSSIWGGITGTITDQVDLVSYVGNYFKKDFSDPAGGNLNMNGHNIVLSPSSYLVNSTNANNFIQLSSLGVVLNSNGQITFQTPVLNLATGSYKMGLKSDNLNSNRTAQFQDKDYVGIADISDLGGANSTEIGYLSGATSNIQNQINNINSGLSWKVAARILCDSNVNISSPGSTLNGVTMAIGDRAVLNGQSTGSQNGVWVWNGASVPMTRATDCSTGGTGSTGVLGMTITIEEGTYADQIWILTNNAPITIGTTSLIFAKSSATTYTGSNGILLTGNNFTFDYSYFSGEASISSLGVYTLSNSAVIGKTLTGYTSSAGTVSSSDSIISAIQKLNGNDALKASLSGATFTGPVNFSGTTNSGLTVNSLTTTQRDALVSPTAGTIIYNSTTGRYDFYTASAWKNHVRLDGDIMTGVLSITDSTASTSSTTGALKVTGGVGIGGSIYANAGVDSTHQIGKLAIYSATTSSLYISKQSNSGSTTNYALLNDSGGNTFINTQGGNVGLARNGSALLSMNLSLGTWSVPMIINWSGPGTANDSNNFNAFNVAPTFNGTNLTGIHTGILASPFYSTGTTGATKYVVDFGINSASGGSRATHTSYFKIDSTGLVTINGNLQFKGGSRNITDDNGNSLISFPSTVASAVNYLQISNSATGSNISLSGLGTDTNVGISLLPKGTGVIGFGSNVSWSNLNNNSQTLDINNSLTIQAQFFGISLRTAPSSTDIVNVLKVTGNYAQSTSGTGSIRYLNITGTLNQTSTSNQDIYGIDINHTYTSVKGNYYGARFRAPINTTGGASWNIFADGSAPNKFGGSVMYSVVTKTSTYTVTNSDYTILCDASGGAFTINLPTAASFYNSTTTTTGGILIVKKTDSSANAITIEGDASELIDGELTKSLSIQWNSIVLQSNGTSWYILSIK